MRCSDSFYESENDAVRIIYLRSSINHSGKDQSLRGNIKTDRYAGQKKTSDVKIIFLYPHLSHHPNHSSILLPSNPSPGPRCFLGSDEGDGNGSWQGATFCCMPSLQGSRLMASVGSTLLCSLQTQPLSCSLASRAKKKALTSSTSSITSSSGHPPPFHVQAVAPTPPDLSLSSKLLGRSCPSPLPLILLAAMNVQNHGEPGVKGLEWARGSKSRE